MPKKSALLCLTPQVREAIELHIGGMSCPAIAKKLGVHETTVRRWFYREDVLEEYRKAVKKQNLFDVAAARRNLRRDLDTEKKGEAYLRQNATFFVLNRYSMSMQGGNPFPLHVLFELLHVDGKERILPVLKEYDLIRQQMQQMAAKVEQLTAQNQDLQAGKANQQEIIDQMRADQRGAGDMYPAEAASDQMIPEGAM